MNGAQMAKAKQPREVVGRILREVRKAERQTGDGAQVGGTGFTILKLRQKPLVRLIDDGKIGQEEIQSAEEISTAFYALTSRLACRGISFDRVDNGGGLNAPWPARVAHAVDRYQRFAKVWTQRNNDYCDPTLAIVVDAVIDETPLRTIAADQGYRLQRVENALVGGLRDYAARAGFVPVHQASAWQAAAESVFGPPAPVLRQAIRRAQIER